MARSLINMSGVQVVYDNSENEKRTKKEKRQQQEKRSITKDEGLNPRFKKDGDSKSE